MPDSQPSTYPTRPPKSPQEDILGGFILDAPTVLACASRLANTGVTPDPKDKHDCFEAFQFLIPIVWKKFRAHFHLVGLDPEVYEYMVVTQRRGGFNGWLGMDPRLVPQFEAGEREALIKSRLEEDLGINCEFKTILW
ncbi:hypothetical protein BDN70DRAFT_990819 [Pholiota conissans]|uniref:Uncharacterized protein n=1 Tax=Pholiota conissans TaxID=109636 RepID=A0A9P5Z965_9AGAR|nr:hypothetical protein BDN70DRAFT_990819 [Pholiota conissans]